jgi:hypothetical protein
MTGGGARWEDSEMVCANLATLRQFQLIQGKANLSAAKSARLPQNQLVRCKADFSGTIQGCARRINLDPGQNKVIHDETRFSEPIQPYPRQSKVIRRKVTFVCRKVDLSAAK